MPTLSILPAIHPHAPVCLHEFTPVRARTRSPTHARAHTEASPCFHASVRVHVLQHMCPPTRTCAHTPPYSCPHTCACVLTPPCAHTPTRVCTLTCVFWGHPAAGAALALRLPPPCPRPWGCHAGQGAHTALAWAGDARPHSVEPGWHAEALGKVFGQQGDSGHAHTRHPAVLG